MDEMWQKLIWAIIDKRKVPPERVVDILNLFLSRFTIDEQKADKIFELIAHYRKHEEMFILSQVEIG